MSARDDRRDDADPDGSTPGEAAYGESRWPMAGAVVSAIVLTILLPGDFRLARWVLPAVEGLLLVVLIAGDLARSRDCHASCARRHSS